MVAAVADAAVAMRVPVVTGERPLEQLLDVDVRAGAGLDQREPGRRMRREHMEEPVGPGITRERRRASRQVRDPATLGRHLERHRLHRTIVRSEANPRDQSCGSDTSPRSNPLDPPLLDVGGMSSFAAIPTAISPRMPPSTHT